MLATKNDIRYMSGIITDIVTDRLYELPSEYNERVRYIPKELSQKHGFVDYNYFNFFREILDNFSPLSPIREVALMKSVQIGATTSILEAIIAYFIGSCPRPQLYISADKELVKKAIGEKVERMLDNANLRHLIKDQSGTSTRKTGDTALEKSYPGGFMHGIGAQSGNKLRSMSYPVVEFDEIDGMPDTIAKEGDPIALARNRCLVPYEDTAKILYISTPLIMQTSKIYKLFMQGDQRYYYVPCLRCGEYIILKWNWKESETKTGDIAGIIFELLASGRIDKKSIFYKCQNCGGTMENHEKSIMLPEGMWQPTAEAQRDRFRSYSINSLYSPVGLFSWHGVVESWIEAWDVEKKRVKDIDKYREFRNTKEGWPFVEHGGSPKYEKVIQYRRQYAKNTIPNKEIIKDNGGPLLILICSVDCHPGSLHIDIKGYCRDKSSYTIDYRIIEGDIENINDPAWAKLEKILLEEVWVADDGKQYKIRMTGIDEGWNAPLIRAFCEQFRGGGVYPVKGAEYVKGNLTYRMMSKEVIAKAGVYCYEVNTTMLKDQVAFNFRLDWNSSEFQPPGYPNFPYDLRDDYFRYFEAEHKAEKIDKITLKFIKFVWKKISESAPNHGFDTFGYNLMILELVATEYCIAPLGPHGAGLDYLQWDVFWKYAETGVYWHEKEG